MFTCSNRIHEQWKQYTVCHSTAPCLEVDREVPVCNHCTPNSRKLHQVTNRNLQICEALSGVHSILVPPIKMVLDVDAIAIMQISTADNMNLKFKCKRKSINHCTNVYWKFHYSLFINHDTTYFSSFYTLVTNCNFFMHIFSPTGLCSNFHWQCAGNTDGTAPVLSRYSEQEVQLSQRGHARLCVCL